MTSLVVTALALVAAQAVPQPPAPSAASPALYEKMACAPATLPVPAIGGIRVVGGATPGRRLFGPGDTLVIDAGTAEGVKPGQQYFVRRSVNDKFTPASLDFQPNPVHTAGWVAIVDAQDSMAVASIVHACDGILDGDFLEPFVEPVVPTPALEGAPDYEHPGRIVMADERRQAGAAGSVMIVNRGSDHDVRPGQTFTIFRPTLGGLGPVFVVGRATVLSVRPQTSVVYIDSTRDAVFIGDRIAVNRLTR